MEDVMSFMNKLLSYGAASLIVMVPVSALSAEIKITPPLIELLQDGRAKLSPDKKVILDEKGDIVARQKSPAGQENSFAKSPDKAAPVAAERPYVCTPQCAIWVKYCYTDPKDFEVCINSCEKELLQCE